MIPSSKTVLIIIITGIFLDDCYNSAYYRKVQIITITVGWHFVHVRPCDASCYFLKLKIFFKNSYHVSPFDKLLCPYPS